MTKTTVRKKYIDVRLNGKKTPPVCNGPTYCYMLPDYIELQQSNSEPQSGMPKTWKVIHTHNNNPSKSALTGSWVITVLLLECFVFRFACSVSKANNHSLFTVWVGLFFFFFLRRGKLHTRVTALRERGDQQPRRVLVSAVLNQGGRDADCSPAVCWLCGKGSKGLKTWIYCTLTAPTTINCLSQQP